jgi:hypothetical protein
LALVILAGVTLGGIALYQAGFAHGAMTNFTWPESAEAPLVPHGYQPYARTIGPRAGLLGFFPLLCFGGFFLLLIASFGFFARRRAWMHCGPEAYHAWKHHGSPPPWWGTGKPPWEQGKTQPETDDTETHTGESGS